MPKMDFPDFYGNDPKVWLDDCKDYFDMYNILEGMWITVAKVHLKEIQANGTRHLKKQFLQELDSFLL